MLTNHIIQLYFYPQLNVCGVEKDRLIKKPKHLKTKGTTRLLLACTTQVVQKQNVQEHTEVPQISQFKYQDCHVLQIQELIFPSFQLLQTQTILLSLGKKEKRNNLYGEVYI